MKRTGLFTALLVVACGDMAGVEEVDRGAKPIEAVGTRSADDVFALAAWDDEGVAHTLVVVAGERRWISVDVQGDVTIADDDGTTVAADDPTGDRLRIAAREGELATLRAELLQ